MPRRPVRLTMYRLVLTAKADTFWVTVLFVSVRLPLRPDTLTALARRFVNEFPVTTRLSLPPPAVAVMFRPVTWNPLGGLTRAPEKALLVKAELSTLASRAALPVSNVLPVIVAAVAFWRFSPQVKLAPEKRLSRMRTFVRV